MWYTRKGDGGDTGLFGSKERVSKFSVVPEALGALDELNSYIGWVRVKTTRLEPVDIEGGSLSMVLLQIQQHIFIIQAELAGAEKTISEDKVLWQEKLIAWIEKETPPITSFSIPGGLEVTVVCDVARTIARRAERRVAGAVDSGRNVGEYSKAYLNRLSSLLFAIARLLNHKSGITEQSPNYD